MNILQYCINGISIGSIYAIIALGYTMVYGIAKMLNFAHGDIIMVHLLLRYQLPGDAPHFGHSCLHGGVYPSGHRH